jgi:putative N6-adenine-specific DNA methylase
LLLIDDIVYMLVDVTGDPLHKRGYRKDAGDAPIKESLAAALVVWGGWKYKTILRDPCCGSGTIPIEAAMMARGISPGRDRAFRYMEMPGYSSVAHDRVRDELVSREYTSTYQIYASDIDPDMVDIARANAVRAGVDDTIIFSVADIQDDIAGSSTRYIDTKKDIQQGTPVDTSAMSTVHIISNPPYDDRMSVADIDGLYTALEGHIQQGSGGYITSLARDMDSTIWKNKKVLNGGTECRFWYM